jgi:signal transduction histidine kinase
MPVGITGDMDLNGNRTEMAAWADMLSIIGQKNSRLYDLVSHQTTNRNRAGAGNVLRELERERSRIARELHAGAGQPLAGIKLNLEMIEEYSTGLPPRGREALARLQTLAAQALDQVRSVSHRLHPPDWQTLSTAEALRGLVESSGMQDRLQTELDIDDFVVEPPHSVKIALYRCTQECLGNIARHSGATCFKLALLVNGPMVELRIEDNGRGFTQAVNGKGIGLRAIREHAGALGGQCHIATDRAGTRIFVQLPLSED